MGCGNSSGEKKKQDAAKGGGGGGGAPQENNRDADKKQAKVDNKKFANDLTFLSKVPLLKRLPNEDLPSLASGLENATYKTNDVVVKQGETGNEFFIIKSGDAQVSIDGNNVVSLKSGDYFGEFALLREEPRMATITAKSTLEVLKITRQKFQELGLPDKLTFANRNAVGAGTACEVQTKPPSPKTDAEKQQLIKGLKDNTALGGVVSLDDARMTKLCDIAWLDTVPSGTKLIEEGDATADYFYVVKEGKFEVTSTTAEDTTNADIADGGASKVLGVVQAGGSFGELALLYLTPRAATVTAMVESKVWVIDRNNFKSTLMQVSEKRINEYIKMLEKADIFSAMVQEEKKKVAEAMVEMHFSKGEVIIQQGENGSTFYLLYEGKVKIVKDSVEVSQLEVKNVENRTPQFFGEQALLKEECRAASVVVVSDTAKALALDRTTFNNVLKPLGQIMNEHKVVKPAKDKIVRKDLKKIGLLGCGGFGTVELWEHAVTGDSYALKGLSKGYIVKTGMQESVMNEKNILMMTNSPFITKLWETFNGSQSLYFLLEPALGGELYATYNRKGLHGSEKHAKFYVAGTVFAFEHCHERNIIYRDLKPENLLLTEMGQVKLTDMGLAKFVIGKTFTTCGTPDYFAPEIIASTGHTNAVDWWTLGILLFELMSGRPPFESAYPMQTYSKVMKGIGKIAFPSKCQGEVEALIKGLLKKEPSERLPVRPGGTQNIKSAKFYDKFDWAKMSKCELEGPYRPVVKSKKDIANFSARKEDMPKQLEYKPDGQNWDKDFATST